jgi:hypothetical protein
LYFFDGAMEGLPPMRIMVWEFFFVMGFPGMVKV